MKNTKKFISHTIIIMVECVVLETLVFSMCIANLRYADRVYTSLSQDFAFVVAQGQEAALSELDYYRVDYTVRDESAVEFDSGFKASQMIRVEKDKLHPYKEYVVSLPPNVLKVMIGFHGKSTALSPVNLKLEKVRFGKNFIDISRMSSYYNKMWDFHALCYCPAPFMRGYYVEYGIIIVLTILIMAFLVFRYFSMPKKS